MPKPAQVNQILMKVIPYAVLVVIGAGYYFFRYVPRMKEFNALELERQQKQKELNDVMEQVKELSLLQQKLEDLRQEITRFNLMLPKEKEIPSLLKQIEMAILREKVEFVSLSTKDIAPKTVAPRRTTAARSGQGKQQKEEPAEKYKQIEIPMQITGKFDNIMRFFSSLLKMPRLVTITAFEITGSADENLRVNLTANTYTNLQGGVIPDGE